MDGKCLNNNFLHKDLAQHPIETAICFNGCPSGFRLMFFQMLVETENLKLKCIGSILRCLKSLTKTFEEKEKLRQELGNPLFNLSHRLLQVKNKDVTHPPSCKSSHWTVGIWKKKHQNLAANVHHGKNSPPQNGEKTGKKTTPQDLPRGKSMQQIWCHTGGRLTLVHWWYLLKKISGDDVGPTRLYIGIII